MRKASPRNESTPPHARRRTCVPPPHVPGPSTVGTPPAVDRASLLPLPASDHPRAFRHSPPSREGFAPQVLIARHQGGSRNRDPSVACHTWHRQWGGPAGRPIVVGARAHASGAAAAARLDARRAG